MNATLKDKVLEFIEIAEGCPPKYQEKCFELLLGNYLSNITGRIINPDEELKNQVLPPVIPKNEQRELVSTDLHLRVQRFLKDSTLDLTHLNHVFYKEEESINLLIDDLKSTKGSEIQIKISLINSLVNAINTGNFEFDGEEVRAECQKRKAYDKANFAANYKNNASLFEAFSTYDKNNSIIKLSEIGKARLAELIKELSA